ncbi:MAG: Glucosaminyl-malate:cysteine ligase [uncultured Truepera sp.]|uniref:Putative cysteine ligase BshC n=1 Tax=uncultured Truepera sp. TaxID=543023 RepID=A0A6J4VRH7_9DEIN|nr:MAG: Glucosaminyl-malate:cysteine ligase [uncultured Truepera sp.]
MPPTPFETAYLTRALTDLYAVTPGDTGAALRQPRPVDREGLAAALRRSSEKLGAPAAVFKNLEQLAHPESRVVVTGQQTGLLLGPLYTLSKAVSAVSLAKRLSTDAKPVVPVFWLASQDADSAEIDHAYLLDLSERLYRPMLPLPEGVPAGRIGLNAAWVEGMIGELHTFEGPEAHRLVVTDLLRRTAARAETFADWFGAILCELLGRDGLIVLNPLEPALAAHFTPVLRAELEEPLRSATAVNAAADTLKSMGYTPQLGRATGATNLFLEEGGKRRLLRFDGTRFSADESTYSRAELIARLDADPTCLTPAAGLRPITQDAMLPTAATVVGPGELRYFAQLRGVYEQHGVAMPLIWPRTTVTILEPPVTRILSKFGLSAAEVQADFGGVRDRTLLGLHGHKLAFDNRLRALKNLSKSLRDHVSAIDPTLENTVVRAEAEMRELFGKLEAKSAAALAERDDTYARQFGRLRAHLLPEGTPQERLISPFSFFLKFGVESVMTALLRLPAEGEHELRI